MARILIDNFFHMPPGHRLSRNISVGGYVTNYGRYSPNDVYHPNGISMMMADLVGDNEVVFSTQPFSEISLCGADILIVPNPDYPGYEGTSPYRIDEEDRDALFGFMERGGSVLLLVNSFYSKSDFWEENFDYERVNPIFERLGLCWDSNFMSDDKNILPSISGGFVVGYGQGGRVKSASIPVGAEPLLTYQGDVFGFVKPVGKGKIAVIGDSGLVSNGLYFFPGFDNKAFFVDLIKKLTPEFCGKPRQKFLKHSYGSISCATSENGVNDKLFKSLRENASYRVDHHYRHLVWENPEGVIGADEAANALPFDFRALSGKNTFSVPIELLCVREGKPTESIEFELKAVKRALADRTEYFVTGSNRVDTLRLPDIGADDEFAKIGKLERVSSVVQIELAASLDGSLLYAAIRQGQIAYIRNQNSDHYGFEIVLGSKGCVYSPVAE